jgi:glycosyltransferase involved in cell wall biosynthesis
VSEPVEVVIDAIALTGSISRSGVGTYTRNLITALAERDDVSPLAICEREARLPSGVPSIRIRRYSRRARARVLEHALRLPVELRWKRPADSVFFNPGFHAFAAVQRPWVQTLLDVIPLVIDAPDQAALRARWARFGPRYRHADAVVAISRHAAREGTRLLGLDPSRVRVAHCGVDPQYLSGEAEGDAPEGRPYILMVGEYSQRKGFAEGFAVADALVEAGYPHRLLVAGQIHPWARDELASLHAATRHPDRIELLGFVSNLVPLYSHADCLIMPSRYEGFGLTCLEAMATGTPVVSFDNSSLTEVVAGAGILVPDGDAEAMTEAVRSVLGDVRRAAEMAEEGRRHARTFTWSASAAIHAEVFREVTGQ